MELEKWGGWGNASLVQREVPSIDGGGIVAKPGNNPSGVFHAGSPCTGEPKHAPTKIAQIYQCLLLTGEVAASAAGGRDNERAKTAHKCCCTVSLYQSPFGDSFLVRGSLCYIGKDISCPLQNKNPDGICRRGAKIWFARFHPRVSLWMRVDLCAASHREGVVPAPACRGILQPRIPSLTAVYARTCLVPLWPL